MVLPQYYINALWKKLKHIAQEWSEQASQILPFVLKHAPSVCQDANLFASYLGKKEGQQDLL